MDRRKEKQENFLLKVASLYYVDGLNQNEIAKRLGTSRPTVVRVLQLARETGLVEIRLTKALPHTIALEKVIENEFSRYGLRQVIVVDENDLPTKQIVARAAAYYLTDTLRKHHIFGIGWSTTLHYVPKFFKLPKHKPSSIVQLAGSAGSPSGSNTHEIAMGIGSMLGIPVEHIPSPVILKDKAIKKSLLQDPVVKKSLATAKKSNIAIIGIGTISKNSTLVETGYLKEKQISELIKQGSVGDILAHFYDINGKKVNTSFDDRRLSVDLEQIRNIDNVIAVAEGKSKFLSIIGALRGGYINTLIIDITLAKEIKKYLSANS